jgi:hypothetical protein
VDSVPVFSACGALWAYYSWKRKGFRRILSSGLLAASVLGTVSGFAHKIHQNDYRATYMPVIRMIRRVAPPRTVVMGGSELGFGLGFGPPLRDDRYVGFFSKVSPVIFVQNEYYGKNRQLPWIWSRRQLAREFHLAFVNKFYKVYLRDDIR